jgi:aspartyl protease family protein
MAARLLLASWLALAANAAQATTVMVMSLEIGRVQVVVDGIVIRQLRAGQISPEGVRLVSADRSKAVIEVDGKILTLALGESTVAMTEVRADQRGHFMTTAHINGVPVQALIDTGATTVALSRDDAQRMGVSLASAPRVQVSTAGGPKFGYRVMLASVAVGAIALRNVEALVMEGGREQLPIVLIGMSFLNSVDMRRAGDTLTLSRRAF